MAPPTDNKPGDIRHGHRIIGPAGEAPVTERVSPIRPGPVAASTSRCRQRRDQPNAHVGAARLHRQTQQMTPTTRSGGVRNRAAGTSAKQAMAERARMTRRVHASATTARNTKPHVSYHGQITGPKTTRARRLHPSPARGPARRVRRRSATEMATARPSPRPARLHEHRRVMWVAEESGQMAQQETDRGGRIEPGDDDPGIGQATEPVPAEVTGRADRRGQAQGEAPGRASRGMRWRTVASASLHHQPKKRAPINAGIFTSAPARRGPEPARHGSAGPARNREREVPTSTRRCAHRREGRAEPGDSGPPGRRQRWDRAAACGPASQPPRRSGTRPPERRGEIRRWSPECRGAPTRRSPGQTFPGRSVRGRRMQPERIDQAEKAARSEDARPVEVGVEPLVDHLALRGIAVDVATEEGWHDENRAPQATAGASVGPRVAAGCRRSVRRARTTIRPSAQRRHRRGSRRRTRLT